MPGSSSDTASLYLHEMSQFFIERTQNLAYSRVLFTMRLSDSRKKWSSLTSCATDETLMPSTVTWPFESMAKPALKSWGVSGGKVSLARGGGQLADIGGGMENAEMKDWRERQGA